MFIEFGILKLKLLIPITYSISSVILLKFLFNWSVLYNFFILSMNFLLAGIIYLIILYKSKSSNDNKISIRPRLKSAVSEIKEKQKKEKKRKKEKKKCFYFYYHYYIYLLWD